MVVGQDNVILLHRHYLKLMIVCTQPRIEINYIIEYNPT